MLPKLFLFLKNKWEKVDFHKQQQLLKLKWDQANILLMMNKLQQGRKPHHSQNQSGLKNQKLFTKTTPYL